MNALLAQTEAALTDLRPTPDDIAGDAVAGLSKTPKRLPSKYFYDARGSELFEAITHQPEYYLTRVEMELLDHCLPQIAAAVGPNAHVVEYGSGSGRKTEQLLEHLEDPVAYTPIEISRSTVLQSTARLASMFPRVEMLPVCADFTQPVALPRSEREPGHTLVFFPGSTLGNFERAEAVQLLRSMHTTMGRRGQALIGIDLVKDNATLEAAYNDAAGITAAFTLNLLTRLNREIGSDFELAGFRHRALYSAERGRIETFLVSQRNQIVTVQGQPFHFADGEAMNVEFSHKYSESGFAELAAGAGLKVTRRWNDARDWFGLRLLEPN